MTAEENELLEIWEMYAQDYVPGHIHWQTGFYDPRKCNTTEILKFWKLKHKIDDYKKQIIAYDKEVSDLREELKGLYEAMQPREITEKDKKRILKDFYEE